MSLLSHTQSACYHFSTPDGAEGKGCCAPELTSVRYIRNPLTSVQDHGYFPSLLATESSPLCVEKRQQRQRHRKICACLLWCSPTPDFIRHRRGACTVAVVTATEHIRKQSAPRAGSRVQTLTNKSISNPPQRSPSGIEKPSVWRLSPAKSCASSL